MSGFEVAGLVLGAFPILSGALEFYESNAKVILRHGTVMDDFIMALKAEHMLFRRHCETLLTGLVEDGELKDILDSATKVTWKVALEGGLGGKLEERLGPDYEVYTWAMAKIEKKLKKLEKVVGLSEQNGWYYENTKYQKLEWHEETWKKMKHCLAHNKHKQLFADLKEYNSRLEELAAIVPGPEQVVGSKAETVDLNQWESITRSAKSLYCALCSGWLCQCGDHVAQFRLEDRTAPTKGSHRFKLEFMLPTSEAAIAMRGGVRWQETEFEASEEGDEDTPCLPGRVSFVPKTSGPLIRMPSKQITDLCSELQQSVNHPDAKCIGFIVEDKHKHYIHLLKRPLAQAPSRKSISLRHLLVKNGKVSSPFSAAIQLLDKYELALLLASSLLQLHTTPWLGERWSTEDIHFAPTRLNMTLRDCAFLEKSFLSTSRQAPSDTPTPSLESSRQVGIRNEAIFRLGATLVELSTTKTLESQETEEDRKIPGLTDLCTAQRVLGQIQRDNVREWNQVVDICLRGGFHTQPDFSKKGFRQEFYEMVVVPLQRLYDYAKPVS